VRPVEPGAGEQLDGSAVEPGVNAVAVELDFVQPLVPFRRRVDQLRKLRRDPLRQRGDLVRFATDSPLEEAVLSELVSVRRFPAKLGKYREVEQFGLPRQPT
jgi:hypothetical protein